LHEMRAVHAGEYASAHKHGLYTGKAKEISRGYHFNFGCCAGGERNETVSNRYTYSVGYEFTLNDGTVIYGNTKVIGNAYSAGIPMGPTAVRYLKVFPSLNALEVDAIFSMGTVILAAAGILLLVVALRREGNKKKYSKRYR